MANVHGFSNEVKETISKDVEAVKEATEPMRVKIRQWIVTVGLIAGIVLSCCILYKLYDVIHAEKTEKVNQPNISLSLDGKASSPTAPQVVHLQGTNTVTKEIQYVPKVIDPFTGQKEKTDVQFDTSKKNVFVKVNGKEHEIVPTVDETQKFENGKLVVEESQRTDIEITGPEPSKWTATYLRGSEGKQGFGVGYAVNKVVRLDAMAINGDPYIGVTVSLGDLSSRSKKKTEEK